MTANPGRAPPRRTVDAIPAPEPSPTAQHHDSFALWNSAVTPWNAMQMGPKCDLIGELSKAVRLQDLKFGVSNHGIDNFQFIHPDASSASRALMGDLKAKHADIYDPKSARLYNVADRSDKVKLPAAAPCKYGYTLKIMGLPMNPAPWTTSGNPQ